MELIIGYIERRISHVEKRVAVFREEHGDNPERTHNYFGGHSLGYWEGRLSTYNDILDRIKDLKVT